LYFGVDESELQLDVSGMADNGLNYGFKIEINANTSDGTVADEVRLQFSGGWGTLQMGDEDGAEDIMNYGGENLMGATGGFDGDQDDYLLRIHLLDTDSATLAGGPRGPGGTFIPVTVTLPAGYILGAQSYPTIAGDTSDQTKISYFSPRLSGFQVGASVTPTANFSPGLSDFVSDNAKLSAPPSSNGDEFKVDRGWENHIGVGANYDSSFGDLRVRASAVYSAASSTSSAWEDISAWSVGGIVGWGPVSLGANYTDNGDSAAPIGKQVLPAVGELPLATGWESSYWNVALAYETGPFYLSVGYFESTKDWGFLGVGDILESGSGSESFYKHLAFTADYTLAAGLGIYAELNLITDENNLDNLDPDAVPGPVGLQSLDTTSVVVGANISF
jgi:hypothetical protein